MTAPMTGRRETRDGFEALVMERRYRAPIADVWAAVTEPGRMERWIGTWSGDPAEGAITFRMTAEGDDVPDEVFDVEACEPPHRFALRSREPQPFTEDGSGPHVHWALAVELSEQDGTTTLTFVQSLPGEAPLADVAGSVGPGWEHYLARLGAHLDGGEVQAVAWDDHATLSPSYRALFEPS